jgi:VIT1/CCC1 family predicted Fe2+/Mn2+ transporter
LFLIFKDIQLYWRGGSGVMRREDFALTALMERLGLGGREMTTSGHSKDFVLKVVQPGLIGLMDGSVSTLAPLFATAFATGEPRITFLVGLAAAVGAAISMGFSEGLSDDGTLTGRGHPFLRGSITGVATFIGGILHTLPFLIPHVNLALYVAFGVVGFELLAISFIRYRYFEMSFLMSAMQVILGGALVFASGILIGSA